MNINNININPYNILIILILILHLLILLFIIIFEVKNMAYTLIKKCPVCSSQMRITRLKCFSCGTSIESDFEIPDFYKLSPEQIKFVEVFLKNRGNIKDVERELKISYPTVRSRLDGILEILGLNSEKEKKVDTREVIDLVEKGELSVDEAIKILKEGVETK